MCNTDTAQTRGRQRKREKHVRKVKQGLRCSGSGFAWVGDFSPVSHRGFLEAFYLQSCFCRPNPSLLVVEQGGDFFVVSPSGHLLKFLISPNLYATIKRRIGKVELPRVAPVSGLQQVTYGFVFFFKQLLKTYV